jgi:predicted  nucleic acid-binding Zn-ribbon protein
MGAMGVSRRNDEARDAVVRLTSAVEHIATQLEVLGSDIKEDRKETFTRLNTVEQRVSKLEARPSA